jgi:glycerophosphoryl diester phosphodiesterase
MLIIGHRGCGYGPENTLAVFQKALDLNVKALEFDVHATCDGKIIIIHDAKLKRTTGQSGCVSEKNLAEMRNLNAGAGEKVPTLEEALDLISRKAKVFIELKGKGTGQPVAEIIKKYLVEKGWQKDDFFVSSSFQEELLDFLKADLGVKIGVVIDHVSVGFFGTVLGMPFGYEKIAREVGASAIIFSKRFTRKKYIKKMHEKNLLVFIFTINKERVGEKMKTWGADGIFSDYPDKLSGQSS